MAKIDFYPQKILIVGNGFDLNQNLPTSYSHFLNSNNFKKLEQKYPNALFRHMRNAQKLNNWIDVENELKIYSESVSYGIETIEFNEHFDLLSFALIDYLKTIDYSSVIENSHSYNLIKRLIYEDFLIIDFNYTNTIKYILESLKISNEDIQKRLIKIHGSVNENSIIFGVEDYAKIAQRFVFIKKGFNKHYKGITFLEQLMKSHEIHFFGHSLGETDHTYFNEFFDSHSQQNSKVMHKKIFLYYYGDESYYQLSMQLDKLTNNRLSGLKQVNNFISVDVKND